LGYLCRFERGNLLPAAYVRANQPLSHGSPRQPFRARRRPSRQHVIYVISSRRARR
jgi:hypothetical protein